MVPDGFQLLSQKVATFVVAQVTLHRLFTIAGHYGVNICEVLIWFGKLWFDVLHCMAGGDEKGEVETTEGLARSEGTLSLGFGGPFEGRRTFFFHGNLSSLQRGFILEEGESFLGAGGGGFGERGGGGGGERRGHAWDRYTTYTCQGNFFFINLNKIKFYCGTK